MSQSPMSPGTYLRKRREAAGLSAQAVAGFLVGRHAHAFAPPPAIGTLEWGIAACERDERPFGADLVARLHGCFPFDLGIYQQLLLLHAGAHCPEPRVCRECACSWNDACRSRSGRGSCALSVTDPTICTACEARAARAAAEGEKP